MTYSAIKLSGAANDGKSVKQTLTQADHGFTAGDVIRWNTGADGNSSAYVKAQANGALNAEVIGVVETRVDASDFVIVYSGEIKMETWTGLNSGDDVFFLSADVAGVLDSTPPTSAGEVIKPVVTRIDTATTGIVTNYIGTSIGGKSTVSLDSIQPIGQLIPWASGDYKGGNTDQVPNGWKMCNGATLDITEYDEFYKHIRWRNNENVLKVPKDGFGFNDPDEGINVGWATRFGWQQEIILEHTAPGLTTGTWIYQGSPTGYNGDGVWAPSVSANQTDGYYNGTEPHQSGIDTHIVIGQVEFYDHATKTLTVNVNALHLVDDFVAGTDETYLHRLSNQFGAWADGATLSYVSETNDNTGDPGTLWTRTLASAKMTHTKVPDMRGKVPIGAAGMYDDLTTTIGRYHQGSYGGKEEHTLVKSEMPLHDHEFPPNDPQYDEDSDKYPNGQHPYACVADAAGNEFTDRMYYHLASTLYRKDGDYFRAALWPGAGNPWPYDSEANGTGCWDQARKWFDRTAYQSGDGASYHTNELTHHKALPNEGGDKPHTNMQPWMAVNYIIRVSTLAQAALLEDISAVKMHELKDAHIEYEAVAGGSFGNMLFYEHDTDGATHGWYDHLPLVRNLSPSSNEDLIFYTSQSGTDLVGTEKMRLGTAGQLSLKDGISADGGATFGGTVLAKSLHATTNPIVMYLQFTDAYGFSGGVEGWDHDTVGHLTFFNGGDYEDGVYDNGNSTGITIARLRGDGGGIPGWPEDEGLVGYYINFPEEERFSNGNYTIQLTQHIGTESAGMVSTNQLAMAGDYRLFFDFVSTRLESGHYYWDPEQHNTNNSNTDQPPFNSIYPSADNLSSAVSITIWTKDV